MFQQSLNQLAAGVHSALCHSDPDLLRLARERCERALDLLEALPEPLATAYYHRICRLWPESWVEDVLH